MEVLLTPAARGLQGGIVARDWLSVLQEGLLSRISIDTIDGERQTDS